MVSCVRKRQRAGAVQDAGALAKQLVICSNAGGCARKVPATQAKSVAARQIPPALALEWKRLFEIRPTVLPGLESLRQNKQIGKALEAKVTATGDEVLLSPIIKWQGDFKELLGVSDLVVTVDGAQCTAGVQFGFSRVDGDRQKCERCWHWETDIGHNAEHPTICGRCVEAVKQLPIPKI